MRYEERAPSPEFARFVENYWAFEVETHDAALTSHVIVPDGTISLTFNESEDDGAWVVVIGPFSVARRVEVKRATRFRGVRFRAGAACGFLGAEMADLIEQRRPLAEICPLLAADILRACAGHDTLAGFAGAFETVARDRLAATIDDKVSALAQALIDSDGSMPLHGLMDEFGLSSRQLRRRFVASTGLSPKTFSRLRRVRRACVELIGDVQVAAVSAGHGYADQPHFSREMKAVFNMSPQLVHAYLRQIRHLNVGGT